MPRSTSITRRIPTSASNSNYFCHFNCRQRLVSPFLLYLVVVFLLEHHLTTGVKFPFKSLSRGVHQFNTSQHNLRRISQNFPPLVKEADVVDDSANEVTHDLPASCLTIMTKSIDDVIHQNYQRVKLPGKRMLRIVRLHGGKITELGNIDWLTDVEDQKKKITSFKTNATLSHIRVVYSCAITAFGSDIGVCKPIDVTAKDVKVSMRVHFDQESQRIKVSDVDLLVGRYILRAVIFGSAIVEENDIPFYLKDDISDLILDLINGSKPRVSSSYHLLDCLVPLISSPDVKVDFQTLF